jgi:DUF971 family protein
VNTSADASSVLTEIKLLQKQRVVELCFADGQRFCLSCEYLRVFSPSAEVRGHGGQAGQLVLDKQQVNIVAIEPVGNYAVRFIFDDGHQTGIYSWVWLYELATQHDSHWQHYLQRVAQAAGGNAHG